MGGDWYFDDPGFTEEERALIGMKETREADAWARALENRVDRERERQREETK